ncbi:MAG TPA: hypothetical protein PLD79_07715 [Halothiobacillus sp.]|nr:hypothetical protein [Halothiobacillus sp.]
MKDNTRFTAATAAATGHSERVVQLSGTQTSFDQLYYPDEITRSMSFDGGFHESVTARNHSASQQVDLAAGGGTQISGLGF